VAFRSAVRVAVCPPSSTPTIPADPDANAATIGTKTASQVGTEVTEPAPARRRVYAVNDH